MKRILLILLILLIPVNAQAAKQSAYAPQITAIESNVFGYEYSNENDNKRLERIEEYLYGAKRSGALNKRLESIQNDIGYVNKEDKITNTPASVNQEKNIETAKQKQKEVLALKEDNTVEYPMVDKMEQTIFKASYKNENIYNRLNRLEKQVFNKTSDEDLNVRVDKLASVVMPKSSIKKRQSGNFSYEEMDNYYRASGLEPINNQSIPFQLAVLEQDILNNEYDNDNVANRLNRLEQKLFNRSFVTDNDITRLQRIMVAYDAKKNSYKYENNKKMQNMAAISQFGGILLMILAILL